MYFKLEYQTPFILLKCAEKQSWLEVKLRLTGKHGYAQLALIQPSIELCPANCE